MINPEHRENIEAAFELLLESVDVALDDVLASLTGIEGPPQDGLGTLTRLAVLRDRLLEGYQRWQAYEPLSKSSDRTIQDYTGLRVAGFALGSRHVAVRTWRELLTEVCRMVYEENPRRFDDRCTEVHGRHPYFSKDRVASGFRAPRQIGRSNWVVETNMNANTIVGVVRAILAVCGHDPDTDFQLDVQP